jgi:hypothetical protein
MYDDSRGIELLTHGIDFLKSELAVRVDVHTVELQRVFTAGLFRYYSTF